MQPNAPSCTVYSETGGWFTVAPCSRANDEIIRRQDFSSTAVRMPCTPGRLLHDRRLLQPPDSQFAVRLSGAALGTRQGGAADEQGDRHPAAGGVHHADPQAQEAEAVEAAGTGL